MVYLMPLTTAPMQTVLPSDLWRHAADAAAASGLTQQQIADELGAQQPHVSAALRPGPKHVGLRIRIVERWGGVRVEGPVYVVTGAVAAE